MKNLICPVSNEKISEHLPRVNALIVILIIGVYVITQNIVVPIFLAIDFLVRGYGLTQYSLTLQAAVAISKVIKLQSAKIDKAPKVFAARLGGIMFLGVIVLQLFGLPFFATLLSTLVASLALLECVIGFCAGCYIYTFIINPVFGRQ